MNLHAGQRIAINVRLMSGWIGCGVVEFDQNECDDVIVFTKADDGKRAMAIRSEVSVIGEECSADVDYCDSAR